MMVDIARLPLLPMSYVLPIRQEVAEAEDADDLADYLERLSGWVAEVLVVDGSPAAVVAAHAAAWGAHVRVVTPDRASADPPDRPDPPDPPDKAAGVVTGARLARHEVVVVADDDVRWTHDQLAGALRRLDAGAVDLLRPQNRFVPAPWHARWDTGRMLVNRATGGDWPGTMVVRRRFLAPGYRSGVLFENLELVRTVRARGGRTAVARDLVVDRRPPTTAWFWRQRVRQGYDELARPWHLVWQLTLLPVAVLGGRRAVVALAGAATLVAEVGRRRGGRAGFPRTAALWAPAWLAERAVSSWLAVIAWLRGGVRYRGHRVRLAATPTHRIRAGGVARIRHAPRR
jgi:hypothetical protein